MLKPKDKPTMTELMNQIYEWRERATTELRLHDRVEKARENAKELFS